MWDCIRGWKKVTRNLLVTNQITITRVNSNSQIDVSCLIDLFHPKILMERKENLEYELLKTETYIIFQIAIAYNSSVAFFQL